MRTNERTNPTEEPHTPGRGQGKTQRRTTVGGNTLCFLLFFLVFIAANYSLQLQLLLPSLIHHATLTAPRD